MICPNCGATIGNRSKTCKYCDSPITSKMVKEQVEIQKGEEQLNKAKCAKCGSTNLSFTREKQKSVKGKNSTTTITHTIGLCKDCGYTWNATLSQNGNANPNKKTNTQSSAPMWLWVLGWICIFPLPLTVLLLRKKEMKPALKYGIIATAWIFYLLIAVSGKNSNDDENKSNQSQQETSIVEEDGTSNIPVENETEIDIMRRSGHPKYYGSTEVAHEIWDDVPDNRIHFADKYYGHNDDVLISMEGYSQGEKNSIIRTITFYPSESISIAEALLILDEYMPYDIIEKWYKYNGSFKVVPNDSSDSSTAYYFVSYCLTDDGSEAYYAKEHSYSGTIDIELVSMDKGATISSFGIQFGTPKYVGAAFLEQNNLERIEWDYDFLNGSGETTVQNEDDVQVYIDNVVEKYNSTADEKLEYVEEFIPSDKNGSHYRTEFRLGAWSDAVGKSYKLGDSVVDIVATKTMMGDLNFRVYSYCSIEQASSLVRYISPLLDTELSATELDNAISKVENDKSANGYYFGKLGLLLIGKNNDIYDFMLKLE